jgi:uncharacterized protein (TIGR02301 family)
MPLGRPQRRIILCLLAVMVAAAISGPCTYSGAAAKNNGEAPKPPEAAAPPAGEEPLPPYEPRLLRLAEILGALSYLQDLCGGPDSKASGQVWRAQMTALLETEGKTPLRKERLAGAYNRSFRGYEFGYRRCTANAQAIITRFLDESGKLAHDIAQHAGGR